MSGRLIANMVVRNESKRFLVPVLQHLNKFVDDICVTDDCSDDETPEICRQAGAHVIVTPEPMFTVNEGELRQLAWDHLSLYAKQGDVIYAVDADELLFGIERLNHLLDQSYFEVFGVWFYHFWNTYQYRVDKAWKPTLGSRIFRYYQGGEFKKSKMACGSEPLYVLELIRQQKVLWDTGLRCAHLGYLRDEDKVVKYERYIEHDRGDYHSRAHIESILDPNPTLVDWEFGPIF